MVTIGRDAFAKKDTYRRTSILLSEATDLTHIMPGAFAEALTELSVALPSNRIWAAYSESPDNIIQMSVTKIVDASLGYIAVVPSALSIATVGDGDVRHYTLSGIPVACPSSHTVTIERRGMSSRLRLSK